MAKKKTKMPSRYFGGLSGMMTGLSESGGGGILGGISQASNLVGQGAALFGATQRDPKAMKIAGIANNIGSTANTLQSTTNKKGENIEDMFKSKKMAGEEGTDGITMNYQNDDYMKSINMQGTPEYLARRGMRYIGGRKYAEGAAIPPTTTAPETMSTPAYPGQEPYSVRLEQEQFSTVTPYVDPNIQRVSKGTKPVAPTMGWFRNAQGKIVPAPKVAPATRTAVDNAAGGYRMGMRYRYGKRYMPSAMAGMGTNRGYGYR